jgi:hypothetical protein
MVLFKSTRVFSGLVESGADRTFYDYELTLAEIISHLAISSTIITDRKLL